jgi:cell filamentation protein
MSDSYSYSDHNYIYINPETGILQNIKGISDPDVLNFVESSVVAKRLKELNDNPIKIKGVITLFKIHHHLFQDIYTWAGKKRVVEISKDGKPFILTSHFDTALTHLDLLIGTFRKIPKNNQRLLAEQLAVILDAINYLHPFREGNGRAQRAFVQILALEKGLILNLNPPDNKDVFERYMKGTIESDLKTLSDLIFERFQTDSVNPSKG